MVISIENAEHYVWGGICDGWHFLKRDTCTWRTLAPGASAGECRCEMSVIQERVPAGGAEVMHYHNLAMLQPPSPAA